ncbi:MAG: polysaccharide deacetylase family protein [Ginsengibacter sp.]
MSQVQQIFQTANPWRWRTFKWSGRLVIFLIVLMIPIVIITLARGIQPGLPELSIRQVNSHFVTHPVTPAGLSARDLKKYQGFKNFILAREKNHTPAFNKLDNASSKEIRAAFYVDWDPQSFYSLKKNISKLNMVVPEWFFIDAKTDTLRPDIDKDALAIMKKNNVAIVPLINNIDNKSGTGEFDGSIIHRILHNPLKKERLINDIVKYIQQYQLQGINIDFEEFNEKGDEPIIAFQKELYEKLHSMGLLVTQDIMPYNDDFNVKKLSVYNDYIFLMAYDEHYNSSVPGPISSQKWIEKIMDETTKDVAPQKLILCFAGYGYDWPQSREAATVTYQQALSNAKQYHSSIIFNNDNYNNSYSYNDESGLKHEVYFTDAASNFNTIRFADEYGTAGTALWRLGSEDDRLWNYYNRGLSNASLQKDPFNFNSLRLVTTPSASPDYIGDGEILNVVTVPEPGELQLEIDSTEGLIAEQKYINLPTKYVIKKYGNVNNQVVLTFDDGPDPVYTPQILDILQKEKVPASFFVVGIEAENNLPLLKRIYKDGYEIGNHTFTHPNIALVSRDRATAEIESTRLLIEAATGHSTILFRPPYNADAEPTTEVELKPIALSKEKSYYTVGESIDPEDWVPGVSADSIYKRTVDQYEANPEKGIILFHDAGGNREATVEALPRIIHYFKSKGVAFTTVAGLLGKTRNDIMPSANGKMVWLNGSIAEFGYWVVRILTSAFWLAIILGFIRIFLMAVMAGIQKIKSNSNKEPITNLFSETPAVSIIVPAFNEEMNSVKTIENLLHQDYLNYDIHFVDDGSTDQTYQFIMDHFSTNEKVHVHSKLNGGKASALNYGIHFTKNEYIVCIDADTQLKSDALSQLMKKFTAEISSESKINTKKIPSAIGAVAGNVKVGNENTMLTKWQSIEYTTAQNFDRRAFDLINGITVVPGAIGAFRKEAIEKAGGFTSDTFAEDCDITIRILRSGYRVVNCPEAVAITEAPETLKQFMKQRFRWTYGIMQSFWKNRDACLNPKYKFLGMVALPNILLFQILLPIIAPLADIMLVAGVIWNRHDPESIHKIGWYYLVFFMMDILVSMIAFIFEKEKFSKLIWLIPQRLVYRQLMYVILFKAISKAIKGESQGWGVLQRTGNVKLVLAEVKI